MYQEEMSKMCTAQVTVVVSRHGTFPFPFPWETEKHQDEVTLVLVGKLESFPVKLWRQQGRGGKYYPMEAKGFRVGGYELHNPKPFGFNVILCSHISLIIE